MSARKDAMYLSKEGGFARVPAPLPDDSGKPALVGKPALNAGRRLARVDTNGLLSQLQRRGWFLQVPPADASRPGAC